MMTPSQSEAQIAWTHRASFGSTVGTDRFSGFAVDTAGNVYATGSFTGTINFGTGDLVCTGNLDGFVAKFSPAGVCQWAIKFGGPSTAQDQGLGIATNGASVFVGGVYQTSLSISGAAAITGYGGIDGFGFKLDAATGATQWASVFGAGSTDAVQAMCIDTSGNMYVTGYFSTNPTYPTATFGSFTRSANHASTNSTDAYVAKLNGATGAVDWVSTGGIAGYNDNVSNSGLAFAPAQNAIVMVGSLQAPSSGTTVTYSTTTPASSVTTTSLGGLDLVVAKLNASNGAFQSVVSVGGASNSNEEALAATYDAQSGYVVMTGYFNTSSLTFGSNRTASPIGSDDIWYAAYNPAADTFAWAKSAGSTIQDRGQSIAAAGNGGVTITGRYRNTMTAPTATTPLSVTSSRTSSADEIYMLRVNSLTGNAEELLTPVGDATITTGDIGTASAMTKDGITWIGGMHGGTTTFAPLAGLTTSGGTTADALIARFNGPTPLALDLISFNARKTGDAVALAWQMTGTAENETFEIQRSTDGRTFGTIGRSTARPSTTEYAWTDATAAACKSEKLYYRLKITDASGHTSFSAIRVVSFDAAAGTMPTVSASPNPFSDVLNVSLNLEKKATVRISIIDVNGRSLSTREVPMAEGATLLPLHETATLIPGTYLLRVEYDGQQVARQIIKQ